MSVLSDVHKIHIVFEKMIEHVGVEINHCEQGDSVMKRIFPSDIKGSLQCENGLKAYVINLMICQMISRNRIQKMIKILIGETLSELTFLKFMFRFYEQLESCFSFSALNNVKK